MLYFALRAFGFLITKHKHKNNNLLFSLTPLVLYSFSPLPYSFIHLPAVFAPYFSPFPFLSLSHFAACVRSSHCPRVTFSLSLLPSHSCSLSPRPHLCNPLSFSSLTHTLSPPYCISILSFSLFSLTYLCLCSSIFLFTFSLYIFSPGRFLILSFI
jgi:hypothetical protein